MVSSGTGTTSGGWVPSLPSGGGPRPLAADPADAVTAVARDVDALQPYTDPGEAQISAATRGLARLLVGYLPGAVDLLAPLGFTTTTDTDPVTGRRFALAVAETATPRAWGLYLVDLSAPTRLCVAFPHPRSDLHCEQLALRLWRAVPGSVLAMASVHRNAVVDGNPAAGVADHARNPRSLLHRFWTDVLGPRGIPQVQVHGFADERAPEQVAVSTGAGPVTAAAARIADEISVVVDPPSDVTRSWDRTADVDLRATTNEQGRAAAAHGWVWVHVEHNRSVRTDEARWHPVIDAIAAADPMLLAYDRPAPPGPDHAPPPVGQTSSPGLARFYARQDHVHASSSVVDLGATGSSGDCPADVRLALDPSAGNHHRIELHADCTIEPPAGGADGQHLLIELTAPTRACTVRLADPLPRCEDAAPAVTLTAGRRCLIWLTQLGAAGWIVTGTAVEAPPGPELSRPSRAGGSDHS